MILFLRLFYTNCIGLIILGISNFVDANGKIEVPEDCYTNKIGFYLYNHKQNTEPYLILTEESNNSIQNAPFDLKNPIKFLIHGYKMSEDHWLMVKLRNEYLKQSKWNVIVLDYQNLVSFNYIQLAISYVLKIGKCAAAFIDLLIETREEITIDQFHLIGFSAGAHIAANIANNLKSGRLERITGLDPALPLFNSILISPHKRLNKQHAKFVDVIITNFGIFGVVSAGAHIDVYVNGGRYQPGCIIPVVCSHLRAMEYFIESINSEIKFWAYKCIDTEDPQLCYELCYAEESDESKWIIVGEHATLPDPEDEGMYMLQTNSQSPFAIEHES